MSQQPSLTNQLSSLNNQAAGPLKQKAFYLSPGLTNPTAEEFFEAASDAAAAASVKLDAQAGTTSGKTGLPSRQEVA
ncbi:TPA: hypothetical protein ACH3X1_008428 [Trebouxia sp. C0004]